MCMSCGILIAYSSSTKSDRSLRHFLFLAREHWAYFAAFIIHLFDSCIFANSRYESTIPSAPSLSIQHDIFNLPVASPTRRTAHTHSQFSESEISIFLLYRFGVNTCVHLTHIFVRNEWHRFESRASNAKPRWMIHENGAASDFSNGHISIVCVRCVHVQAYTIFSERTENWGKKMRKEIRRECFDNGDRQKRHLDCRCIFQVAHEAPICSLNVATTSASMDDSQTQFEEVKSFVIGCQLENRAKLKINTELHVFGE